MHPYTHPTKKHCSASRPTNNVARQYLLLVNKYLKVAEKIGDLKSRSSTEEGIIDTQKKTQTLSISRLLSCSRDSTHNKEYI